MNIVPDLFPFVPIDLVLATLQIALDQVAEKTVQFHAGMIGSGKTTAAQATCRHAEVTSIFLNHQIRRCLGCAKQRMFRVIDGKGLRNSTR
jgi:hypothetical protein